MFGFGQLIDILKKSPKKIVFTEGSDPRILEAASRLLASSFLHPILVGDEDEIYASAEESGFNIRGAQIINPKKFDRMDEMIDLFCELRKSKGVTPEQAKGILSQANYFGTMLVKRMEKSGAKAYLVNTGWNGTGKRISIRDTRGIIDAILDGSIDKAPTKTIPYFNFVVPTELLRASTVTTFLLWKTERLKHSIMPISPFMEIGRASCRERV